MLSILKPNLRQRLALPLPGAEAQFRMAHAERRMNRIRYKVPADARKGSVLLLLYEDSGTVRFPLILRPEYNGVHSGQIALPGGEFEASDKTMKATALREAQEETGIFKNDVEIIGSLTELYIPPSNFLVYPFIGALTYKPTFIPDPKEVSALIEMDVEKLMDDSCIGEKEIRLSNGLTVKTPYFNLDGYTVWGATAMILSELKSVLFEVEF